MSVFGTGCRFEFAALVLSTVAPMVRAQSDQLVWTQGRALVIKHANPDGTGVCPVTPATDPHGLAFDVVAGKMYWTNQNPGTIYRANMDGSGPELLIGTGLDNPSGIDLDVLNQRIYWVESGSGFVRRATTNGASVETLVSTGAQPVGIAVDVSGGKMYWSFRSGASAGIARSNLDGSGVQVIATAGIDEPNDVELDLAAGKIYWADSAFGAPGNIRRANLDGSSIEDVVASTPSPFGLALDLPHGAIYWSDIADDKIRMLALSSGLVVDVLASSDAKDVEVLAYDFSPTTYCTAKVNSCGGVPAISSVGAPSASATSGFVISASNVRSNKLGILIYTDAGRGSLPFAGGTLCIGAPPIHRSVPVLSTGTSGQCDGTFALDMNCFASGSCGGNPKPYLSVPGQRVNCQWWGRDTFSHGELLSDGLEYVVCY